MEWMYSSVVVYVSLGADMFFFVYVSLVRTSVCVGLRMTSKFVSPNCQISDETRFPIDNNTHLPQAFEAEAGTSGRCLDPSPPLPGSFFFRLCFYLCLCPPSPFSTLSVSGLFVSLCKGPVRGRGTRPVNRFKYKRSVGIIFI